MSVIGTGAAVVLAWAFVWSGFAKLLAQGGTAESFKLMGLPQPRRLAVAVPVIELGIALSLLLAPGWGGVVSFALLAAFTTTLFLILRKGEVVACACFGGASTAPVRPIDLVRNAVLLALAGTAATTQTLAGGGRTLAIGMGVSLALGGWLWIRSVER